jgi:ADP-heptose:LPS heptosyltransferase
MRERLARHGTDAGAPFVLVNAGARPGSAKGADPQLLARALTGLGVPLVLVCGPGEEENARATAAGLAGSAPALLDDPAPALDELVALIALAHAVVTPDSGPRHLAQALARPTIVLCGPTDPRHTAEHAGNVRVLRTEVDCGPCHRETCPLSGDARDACMRRIDPAALTRVLREALDRG